MNEDLGQFARSNDELGNEVNSIVAVTPKLSRNGLVGPEFAVELVQMMSCTSSRRQVSYGC